MEDITTQTEIDKLTAIDNAATALAQAFFMNDNSFQETLLIVKELATKKILNRGEDLK